MRSLGVLCIGGLQTHQENHASGFDADERSHIVAIADEVDIDDRRRALNIGLAEQYGVPYIEGIEKALALPEVDVVSMCADVERRHRMAVACAEAGKILYLDKPLAASAERAGEVLSAISKSNVTSQMYSFVHTPWAKAAKECVESGRLGKLLAVHTDILFAKGSGGTAAANTPRRETAEPAKFTFVESKREFFDLGVYTIGLCLWLADAEPQTVSAEPATTFSSSMFKTTPRILAR
jgi:predicted dehydrogenase